MAVAGDVDFKIEKLTGENYHNWKFQMKMCLIGKDLWEIVTGTEVLAEGASAQEQRSFRKRENQALACVCLSVATSLQIYVRSAKSSKEAWDNLASHFEEKSLSKKIFYRRKLYSARMEKGTNMVTHINYVKTLSEHLESVDDPIAEKDLVIILISSLPDEYNYLITALETIAEDKLTWNYVRDRLIHEFDKIQNGKVGKENPTQEALISSRGQEQRKPRALDLKKITCHYCKKKGHFARDCFKKKADQKKPPSAEFANKIEEVSVTHPEVALATGGASMQADGWWIDSGASQHMTHEKGGMENYSTFRKPLQVRIADNTILYAYGKGNIGLTVFNENETVNITLKDVLYVPKLRNKLLSLPSMTEKGVEVQFKGQSCKIIINDEVYSIGHKHGKLYKLNLEPQHSCCYGSTDVNNDLQLWHNRYGHIGYDNLKLLYNKSMITGMNLRSKEAVNEDCEACAFGKQNRQSFPKKSVHQSTQPLELIHSDVCGPMSVPSLGASRYFVTFIDDFSRYTAVYMMKSKSEVLERFKEFVALFENITEKRVKRIRSDNGGEYTSEEFKKYCKDHGIIMENTIPYTPQQNGVSERMNRTVMETARSLLHHAGLPLTFWAEAVSTAVYVRNRSPTSSLNGKTPYEVWHNEKPNVSHLKVFGCDALVHIPAEKRTKLEKKSMKCIFVGYPSGSKGYKLYNPETKKMIRSRDVIFLENSFQNALFINRKNPKELLSNTESSDSSVIHLEGTKEATDNEIEQDIDGHAFDNPANQEVGATYEENFMREVANLPDARRRRPPARLGEEVNEENSNIAAEILAHDIDEPRNIYDAWNGEYSSEWKASTDEEFASLIKNKTWDLVPLPSGKNVVGSKWVFKVKRNADGSVDRFKSRLVAQGYSQTEGIDYQEVFSPVIRYSSIRALLAMANKNDLEIHQMDVKTAFLQGNLDSEIYMKQPEGYVNADKPNHVCKLNKGIYGLKQAARCWNAAIDAFLKGNGYKCSTADSCLYIKSIKEDNGQVKFVIIALYVDDILIVSNNNEMLNAEKKLLGQKFDMVDQGKLHYILGMSIHRDRAAKTLKIKQSKYLESVLKKFDMENCKPVSTPLEPGRKFVKLQENETPVDVQRYQMAIGCLTYAATATRPDIAAAVGVLSQFMSNPSKEHWQGIKRIFRYIKGTVNYGLVFKSSSKMNSSLYGYSDADWGGDLSTRKSTSGYLFKLCSGIVSWKAKKQSVIALSSTEAEYVALCSATQEAVWLRGLLKSIGFEQVQPTTVYEDNQGAIALSKNTKNHAQTKHIDIKFHYIREAIEKNEIQLEYCPTELQIADALTKGLAKQRFEELRTMMGIIE